MRTEIREDRLLVISDLHLGNPFSNARQNVVDFLRYAADEGFAVCINGDGLEIAQTSLGKLARDVPEVFAQILLVARRKLNLYYVVGNHDIVLEHFIEGGGAFNVVPFLNLYSGDKRIRIEHGHLYDPFFVKHPDLYEFVTWFAGILLHIAPAFYRVWMAFERLKSKLRRRGEFPGIVGERPEFAAAAQELTMRGFDAVTFGHTHHPGRVDLGNGKEYINSGSWLMTPTYVEIINGKIELKVWNQAA